MKEGYVDQESEQMLVTCFPLLREVVGEGHVPDSQGAQQAIRFPTDQPIGCPCHAWSNVLQAQGEVTKGLLRVACCVIAVVHVGVWVPALHSDTVCADFQRERASGEVYA